MYVYTNINSSDDRLFTSISGFKKREEKTQQRTAGECVIQRVRQIQRIGAKKGIKGLKGKIVGANRKRASSLRFDPIPPDSRASEVFYQVD